MERSDLRKQRERRRREVCREAILRAAERVIVRKGYSAATMDDIAREAQFSKATLYKYFPGKGELVLEIIGSYFDEIREALIGILASGGNACDKLLAAIRSILRYHEEKENLTRVLWMDKSMLKILRVFVAGPGKEAGVSAGDRKMSALLRRKRRLVTEAGARILEEGIASGEFRPMDTKAAVAFLEAILQGYTHARLWLRETASAKASEDAEMLLRFVLQGIQNPARYVKEN